MPTCDMCGAEVGAVYPVGDVCMCLGCRNGALSQPPYSPGRSSVVEDRPFPFPIASAAALARRRSRRGKR